MIGLVMARRVTSVERLGLLATTLLSIIGISKADYEMDYEMEPWSDQPWMAKMYVDGEVHLCGGVFLNTHTILTAAHCLYDEQCQLIESDKIEVSDFNERKLYQVGAVSVHPGYNCSWKRIIGRQLTDDIAVLKITSRMDLRGENAVLKVRKSKSLSGGSHFAVTAFEGKITPLYRMQLSVLEPPFLAECESDCARDREYRCTGYSTTFELPIKCSGEGFTYPFRVHVAQESNELIGIFARTHRECQFEPYVNTRVSQYYDWIERESGNNFIPLVVCKAKGLH